MRQMLLVAALCVVGALPSAGWSQTEARPDGARDSPAAGEMMTPQPSRPPRGLPPVAPGAGDAGMSLLTVNECKNLGGTVVVDRAKVCPSGRLCATVGEDGRSHAVCITKR
jgi:hypothetical protein